MSESASKLESVKTLKIRILKGPHEGEVKEFNQSVVIIGRGAESHLTLSADPKVSRKHIEITQDHQGFKIINLSESNPAYLDKETFTIKVIQKKVVLQVGDSEIELDSIFPAQVISEKLSPLVIEEKIKPLVSSNSNNDLLIQKHNVLQKKSEFNVTPIAPLAPKDSIVPRSSNLNKQINTQIQFQELPKNESSVAGSFQDSQKRFRFILIIIVLASVVLYFIFDEKKKSSANKPLFRGSEQIEMDLAESQKAIENFKERKEKLSSTQFMRAQENYLKGFRDYRAGFYARARESFQVVLNLDPENELAKRYFQLSKIKFDEQVKMFMLQGHANREKKNYRMCVANFRTVINMISNDKNSSTYKEADQFLNECQLAMEGNF